MRLNRALLGAGMTVALIFAASCETSRPPAAISKSKYSTLTKEEQQTLPSELKLLTLSEAQGIAIQNNPSFKRAYFAIQAARAQYYKAFSAYFPTVTATYDLTYSKTDAKSSDAASTFSTLNSSPALSASLLVFDSFAREMNVLAARHNWQQSAAAELDARRILLRSVAYAYNNVMLANARIKIAIADMQYNRDLLKETELKFGVGAVPLSDVLNFKVKYNNAESSLYSAEYSYATSKYALAELMGLTQAMIPDSVQFPEMPSADGEMLFDVDLYLDMALANRPDLRQYREALNVAKYNYYATIAAFGPSVTASLNIGYYDNQRHTRVSPTDPYDGGLTKTRPKTFQYGYGIKASWTLFSGGSRYFNMRSAQAAMTQADYAVASTWIGVVSEVRTAYDNYLTNLKLVKLNQKNLEIVRKTRDLVSEEYNAGSTSITRVNEAQRDLVNAETSLANAVINMHNAKAQLQAATNSI